MKSLDDYTTLGAIVLVLFLMIGTALWWLPQKWQACERLYDNKPAPTYEELDELWNSEGIEADFQDCRRFARAYAARWGRPAIKPVPVSERPWEWEGWCDTEGMCWRFDPCDRGWWSYGPILPSDGDPAPFTHLLPHHALPIPTTHK